MIESWLVLLALRLSIRSQHFSLISRFLLWSLFDRIATYFTCFVHVHHRIILVDGLTAIEWTWSQHWLCYDWKRNEKFSLTLHIKNGLRLLSTHIFDRSCAASSFRNCLVIIRVTVLFSIGLDGPWTGEWMMSPEMLRVIFDVRLFPCFETSRV